MEYYPRYHVMNVMIEGILKSIITQGMTVEGMKAFKMFQCVDFLCPY